MKTNGTYGPEDLESLLMEKEFNSLYPEEKEFVLKHMADEYEYAELRDLLLGITQEMDAAETMPPPPGLRQKMTDLHRDHHRKPKFTIWLNSLFAMMRIPENIGRPAFQLASILAVVLVAWWLLPVTADHELAIQQDIKKESEKNTAPVHEDLRELEDAVVLSEDKETDKMQYEAIEPTESIVNAARMDKESGVIQESPTVQSENRQELDDHLENEEENYFKVPENYSGKDMAIADESDIEQDEIMVTTAPKSASSNSPSVSRSIESDASLRMLEERAEKKKEKPLIKPETNVSPTLISMLYTSW